MSQDMPILSIIIPFRNRMQLLSDTLCSLSQQQSVKETVKLILIDNNSDHTTFELVNNWINKQCPKWIEAELLSSLQPGASCARNAGLEKCDTEWVMFFDSDDLMPRNHIACILKAIKANPHYDLLFWNAELFVKGKHAKFLKPNGHDIEINVVLKSIWSTQRYVVKSKFIKASGSWDNNLPSWNDWELSIRMLLNEPRYLYLKKLDYVKIFSHSNSITGVGFSHSEGKWEMALQKARQEAEKYNNKRIITLIDIKAAMLAGIYKREKNDIASNNILLRTLQTSEHKCLIRFCYMWQRIVGRGVTDIATIFLPL